MSEAWQEGYDAYYEGLQDTDNPYNYIDGHDMHPDEYFEWQNGWYIAEATPEG